MKKPQDQSIMLRISSNMINEVDEFVETWKRYGITQMTRSEFMRNAMAQHIILFHPETLYLKGNYFGIHLDQEAYKISALFDVIVDIENIRKNEDDKEKLYIYEKLSELLSKAYKYEIEANMFKGTHYQQTGRLSVNKRKG